MEEITRVVLDAMGGDNAPHEVVKGAVKAVKDCDDINVILVGVEDIVKAELNKYTYPNDRIAVVNADEVIKTDEKPTVAIRKKNSSIVVGLNIVKEGMADAFVSAGNSGAVLAGGMLLVGRVKGIERPPFAPLIPTEKGVSILLDCGANVDARPSHLVQFAILGSLYMEHVVGVKNPTVALLNIGAEEDKGNALCKETYPLLKECKDINFIGNIEAREVPAGAADVVVSEGFAGNIALKMLEGTGRTILSIVKEAMMSSLRSKIGALLVKPALKGAFKKFDATSYGGAPLLGCKGLVVKTHGNAKMGEIYNTIMQCRTFKKQNINDKIKDRFSEAEE
ncbi:MAG: phosphate acyltransferase PlsX [Lachnospiraceae bacterium]|nr:phosphate acyltransferase PlsX [Lachnospiraceae bacterium]